MIYMALPQENYVIAILRVLFIEMSWKLSQENVMIGKKRK